MFVYEVWISVTKFALFSPCSFINIENLPIMFVSQVLFKNVCCFFIRQIEKCFTKFKSNCQHVHLLGTFQYVRLFFLLKIPHCPSIKSIFLCLFIRYLRVCAGANFCCRNSNFVFFHPNMNGRQQSPSGRKVGVAASHCKPPKLYSNFKFA